MVPDSKKHSFASFQRELPRTTKLEPKPAEGAKPGSKNLSPRESRSERVRLAELTPAQRIEILQQLRDARALLLRDSESFHRALITLEQVGQILAARVGPGLGAYRREIVEHANQVWKEPDVDFDRLFEVVKQARNTAVHDGAWARHLSSRLIDLFLALEEWNTSSMTHVSDLMVRQPVVAHHWNLVAHIRQMMLANSFSTIPYSDNPDDPKRWHFLTDYTVMSILRQPPDMDWKEWQKEKSRRLGMRVDRAVKAKLIKPKRARCCRTDDRIDAAIKHFNGLPLLVLQEKRLVGILTPFDLL